MAQEPKAFAKEAREREAGDIPQVPSSEIPRSLRDGKAISGRVWHVAELVNVVSVGGFP